MAGRHNLVKRAIPDALQALVGLIWRTTWRAVIRRW
jgi:hypothetical protein